MMDSVMKAALSLFIIALCLGAVYYGVLTLIEWFVSKDE